jgi:hypothetical protein
VTDAAQPERPSLVVVHGGSPTDEEVVALVVALSAATSPSGEKSDAVSRWADRRTLLRGQLRPGPDAWVASARPSR